VRGTLRLGLAAVVLAVGLGVSVSPSMADDTDPLVRATQAARTLTFSGDVTVRWIDGDAIAHSTTLHVDAGNGVVRIGGGPPLAVSTSDQRWLFRHGEWDLVSPSALPDSSPASASARGRPSRIHAAFFIPRCGPRPW